MNKKNILLCISLFVLTALASTYYYMRIPVINIASTQYNPIPMYAFGIIFPLVWGIVFFVLAYSRGTGGEGKHLAQLIIKAVFLAVNILAVLALFNYSFSLSSYNLILAGVLFADTIFEIIQIFASKKALLRQSQSETM